MSSGGSGPELDHAFLSVTLDPDRLHDITITELFKLDFLPNQRLVPLLRGGTEFPVKFNAAQEGTFGMTPFRNDSRPMWTGTAHRLVHTALNLRQIHHGSQISFGRVAANFSHSAARNMVLIAVSSASLDAHSIKILGLSTESLILSSSEEQERM